MAGNQQVDIAEGLTPDKVGTLKLRTIGWQVSSIDDNVRFISSTGRNFVQLTKMEESGVRINCYEAGASDEMHCHPGSEHSFVVWKGKLHITGVEDGEDVIVGPGEFVQIDAGYYYRLHNPGPEPAVYIQFHSIRAKQPSESTVLFSQSARGKRAAAAESGS
jgi:mannose-6-phosphate isomerase-like protein (cupin superfamily)